MALMYNPANETRHTLASLATVPTPAARGKFHHPYSFADYAETVARALPRAGLRAAESEFAVSKDGNRMFGVIALDTGRDDLTWQIGLRGSHDQSVARGLVAGERVTVCSNLMFSGAVNLRTKQTTNIEKRIEGLVIDAVEQMPGYFAQEADMVERLKNASIKNSWGDAALVEIFRRGGLSGNQLAVAVNEWHEPSFDHGDEFTAWRLEQACTQALKPTGQNVNMDLVADRSRTARATITELFKLAA